MVSLQGHAAESTTTAQSVLYQNHLHYIENPWSFICGTSTGSCSRIYNHSTTCIIPESFTLHTDNPWSFICGTSTGSCSSIYNHSTVCIIPESFTLHTENPWSFICGISTGSCSKIYNHSTTCIIPESFTLYRESLILHLWYLYRIMQQDLQPQHSLYYTRIIYTIHR